ncbi:hypothetical protein QYF61_012502 [Mycteria americana]|uniref:Uncharacterized protein n=1 Tax=Mycteria americana TaxID=33587 RepID=A0AAN7S3C8_MYCAM|nr:hypothetical protein QYF61_012502 [Mycteria americana]
MLAAPNKVVAERVGMAQLRKNRDTTDIIHAGMKRYVGRRFTEVLIDLVMIYSGTTQQTEEQQDNPIMGQVAIKPDLLCEEGPVLEVCEEYGGADSALQDSEPSNLTLFKHFKAHVIQVYSLKPGRISDKGKYTIKGCKLEGQTPEKEMFFLAQSSSSREVTHGKTNETEIRTIFTDILYPETSEAIRKINFIAQKSKVILEGMLNFVMYSNNVSVLQRQTAWGMENTTICLTLKKSSLVYLNLGLQQGDTIVAKGKPKESVMLASAEHSWHRALDEEPALKRQSSSSAASAYSEKHLKEIHLVANFFLSVEEPSIEKVLLYSWTTVPLRCPSLDMLQHLNIPLVVGGPTLNTVFEVRPHQCRVQGHDHFPTPAGHAIFATSQDAIGFVGHLGTLLAHIQAAVNQHPQVLLCQAAFQPLFPRPVALHGVVMAQVQDLALGLVEPHTIDLSPSIQPVQIPLQSLPTLQQINTPTQLGVVCKLTEGALDPFVQIMDKDIKQNWPQHRALGNTACDRPPTGYRGSPKLDTVLQIQSHKHQIEVNSHFNLLATAMLRQRGQVRQIILKFIPETSSVHCPGFAKVTGEYNPINWAPQFKKDVKVLECVQRRAPKLVERLEGMFSEEWLRTQGLSCLERRRLRGNLTAVYSFLRRGRGEGGADLSSLVPSARACGNFGSKLHPSGESKNVKNEDQDRPHTKEEEEEEVCGTVGYFRKYDMYQ